jgi:hypothetical protein
MPPQQTKNHHYSPILIVVIAIIIIGGVFYMNGKSVVNKQAVETPAPPANTQNNKIEDIKVVKVDLSQTKTGVDRLPQGFPTGIPVETQDVFVSDTKSYPDRTPPEVMYTVNYRTTKSVSDKYTQYLDYMTKNNYVFGANGKDSKNHVLYGTKGTASLLVSVFSNSGKTVVQLVYLVKK